MNFMNWIEQAIYNDRVNEEERLYTKTQLKRYFHLKPKRGVEPILKTIDFVIFKDNEELFVSQEYKFFKLNQCEEMGESFMAKFDAVRKEHNALNDNVNPVNVFNNKVVCFTGVMERPRKEMMTIADKFGASSTNSVTKKTNLLVVGKDAGSKLEKAQSLNIEIINESDFWDLVE